MWRFLLICDFLCVDCKNNFIFDPIIISHIIIPSPHVHCQIRVNFEQVSWEIPHLIHIDKSDISIYQYFVMCKIPHSMWWDVTKICKCRWNIVYISLIRPHQLPPQYAFVESHPIQTSSATRSCPSIPMIHYWYQNTFHPPASESWTLGKTVRPQSITLRSERLQVHHTRKEIERATSFSRCCTFVHLCYRLCSHGIHERYELPRHQLIKPVTHYRNTPSIPSQHDWRHSYVGTPVSMTSP